MRGVLTAEVLKLTRHRAIWGLVWIFPLGIVAIYLFAQFVRATHPAIPHRGPETADKWIADLAVSWMIAESAFGRYLIAAFAALAFGGEYGWNTWKLIAPHRRRAALIAAKFIVVVGLLMLAFILAAILLLGLGALSSLTRPEPMPAGITLDAILRVHAAAALSTLASTLLTVGYASAAAIAMRSMVGGTIAAVAAVTIEGLLGLFAPLLDRNLYLALPTYQLHNLQTWIKTGLAAAQPLPSGLVQLSWTVSLGVVGAWIVGLWALTFVLFERQDLN